MDELRRQARELQTEINQALQRLKFDELVHKKELLEAQSTAPDFWHDPQKAQEIIKQQTKLERRTDPWQQLKKQLDEVLDFLQLEDAADDITIVRDLQQQIDYVAQSFKTLKEELKFAGPYDAHDVILSIYAGAGGTDAQDWAQMLQRMYVRWAETHDCEVQVIDESAGDEAGIKSATLEISGNFVYGQLKGEHGVHRLVRLSPFNADNLRQTSFAKVDVLPKIDRPEDLVIDDKDLRIDVYRSGGHGGQSVNTTDSAVRITHLPTGISVAIQNERSQLQNKETALTILRSRLIQLQLEQHQKDLNTLKGPNQSAEWGNQIRSYVLHPYKQVKDLRTRYETSDVQGVLDGNLDLLIQAYLDFTLGNEGQ